MRKGDYNLTTGPKYKKREKGDWTNIRGREAMELVSDPLYRDTVEYKCYGKGDQLFARSVKLTKPLSGKPSYPPVQQTTVSPRPFILFWTV